MTDSLYSGTIQIWQNLNEHHYYLTLTKSVICQIDANYSPFQSLNMLPFHIRLERLKLIYYSLKFASFSYLHMYLPSWACFLIIFVSDGKFDNSMGVRKRTN